MRVDVLDRKVDVLGKEVEALEDKLAGLDQKVEVLDKRRRPSRSRLAGATKQPKPRCARPGHRASRRTSPRLT
jgi:hypothetical protein